MSIEAFLSDTVKVFRKVQTGETSVGEPIIENQRVAEEEIRIDETSTRFVTDIEGVIQTARFTGFARTDSEILEDDILEDVDEKQFRVLQVLKSRDRGETHHVELVLETRTTVQA